MERRCIFDGIIMNGGIMADLKVSLPKPCGEQWEARAPQGCNRHCAVCDTTIHDLSSMTVDETEALLLSGEEVCVRAEVARNGTVRTAHPAIPGSRRIVAAIGASVSLAAAACQPATISHVTPRYEINGHFNYLSMTTQATLTSSTGKTYKSRINGDQQFRFTNLPAGTYKLSFDDCGEMKEIPDIVVFDDVDMGEVKGFNDGNCIIIGKLKLDDGVQNG